MSSPSPSPSVLFSDELLNPDVQLNNDTNSSHVVSSKMTANIVGAGLVGSLMACMLGKRGWKVDVYEARKDLRTCEVYAGRSINLALSHRGICGLEVAGKSIAENIVRHGIPMRARCIHGHDGSLTRQPYGTEDQYILSVDRRKLNEFLLSEAESYENVNIHFEHKLQRCNVDTGELYFDGCKSDAADDDDDDDNVTKGRSAELTIGTDGAYSSVRKELLRRAHFNYSQEYIPHGYKELCIPPTEDGSFRMYGDCLHIWPRQSFMLIALPNLDHSFTVTLFMPFDIFNTIHNDGDVLRFFQREFPDAVDLIGRERLLNDFRMNPTSPLMSIKCGPYHAGHNIVLLGDAAHAMVPFYGQGMNAGFEDCCVLNSLLDRFDDRASLAVPEYSTQRQENAHAICDLALSNYIEMRSSVTRKSYLLRKKLDGLLHSLFPATWIPLYTMVSFTCIPYAEVIRKRQKQDVFLDLIGRHAAGLGLMTLAVLGYRKFCR